MQDISVICNLDGTIKVSTGRVLFVNGSLTTLFRDRFAKSMACITQRPHTH